MSRTHIHVLTVTTVGLGLFASSLASAQCPIDKQVENYSCFPEMVDMHVIVPGIVSPLEGQPLEATFTYSSATKLWEAVSWDIQQNDPVDFPYVPIGAGIYCPTYNLLYLPQVYKQASDTYIHDVVLYNVTTDTISWLLIPYTPGIFQAITDCGI